MASDGRMEIAQKIADWICSPDIPGDSDVAAIATALANAEREGMRRAADGITAMAIFKHLKASKLRNRGEIARAVKEFVRAAILSEAGDG